LDIIDVVDDVPTVAVTVDTNDFGSITSMATIGNVDKSGFNATATNSNANLTVVSGTTETEFYHGVAIANFGATNFFDLWAPVQAEADLGTASNNVDQTLYMPDCFVNSIEMSYSAGATSTENYGAETDTKMWLLNSGKYVSQEEWDEGGALAATVTLGLKPTTSGVATMSDSTRGFLYTSDAGERAIRYYDSSAAEWTNYAIDTNAATATKAYYNATTNEVTLPTGISIDTGDKLKIRYAANFYAVSGDGDADRTKSGYFTALAAGDTVEPEDVGALRQGQVEIYLVDPDVAGTDSAYELALRVSSCTITVNMTREALNELGHLKPYERSLTFPVEITTAIETTAGDLELFAKMAGKEASYDADTLVDLTINDLQKKDNLVLVVMVYQQTDSTAGGSGSNRKVLDSAMVGTEYFVRGNRAVYAAINPASPEREYPLKTVIVPGLKATDENYNLAVGSNASYSMSFRSVNKLFAIKGYVDMADVVCTPGLQLNA